MPKDTAIKVPNMSIEAEQGVLGACFISRDAIKKSQSLLNSRDFYRESHRKIFDAFCHIDSTLNGSAENIDLYAMRDELTRRGEIEITGDVSYLCTLIDAVPTASNVEYHAQVVHEKALIRHYNTFGHLMVTASETNDADPELLRQKAQDYIDRIEERPRPAWAFWKKIQAKNREVIEFDTIKYLSFVSKQFGFKTFTKRDLPVIVLETADGFEYATQRSQQVISVKIALVDFLTEEGFPRVASEILHKPRLFSLDVLENLPEIDRKKVENSIFYKKKTRVTLQGEYNNTEPFLTYRPEPDSHAWELISRHDVGIIVARQGNGKTKSLELLLSEMLLPGCEPECPFEMNLEEDEVIVMFATEGKEDDHKRMLRRIAKRTHAVKNNLLNDEGEFKQLIVESCGTVAEEIGFWILEKLESIKEKIGLLIIDTLIDTTPDMNVQQMANAFYVDLMNAAQIKNCAVLCTIHAAPGSKDDEGKAMGHLGSLFMRKNTMMLQIKKISDNGQKIHILTSDFRNAKSRNSDDSGIYAAFSFGDDGMAHFINYSPEDSKKLPKKAKEIEANFRKVLGNGSLTKSVLISRYCKYAGCTDKTARNHYESMRQSEIIKNEAGKVVLCKDLF
jgi:hypothetical protein